MNPPFTVHANGRVKKKTLHSFTNLSTIRFIVLQYQCHIIGSALYIRCGPMHGLHFMSVNQSISWYVIIIIFTSSNSYSMNGKLSVRTHSAHTSLACDCRSIHTKNSKICIALVSARAAHILETISTGRRTIRNTFNPFLAYTQQYQQYAA